MVRLDGRMPDDPFFARCFRFPRYILFLFKSSGTITDVSCSFKLVDGCKQQHNHTTTQPHNHTTTQQHNNTTTQQHNNTTINNKQPHLLLPLSRFDPSFVLFFIFYFYFLRPSGDLVNYMSRGVSRMIMARWIQSIGVKKSGYICR